jgi:ABC-type transport system involved in multi-copper enzyme maturation permease subunit
MNGQIFWRILWKEYRTQRSFWISVVLLTAVAEMAWLTNHFMSEVAPKVERFATPMFATALAFAALYGLGSAATLFATERENDTYDLLRALPVRPREVFWGKVVFAVGSTAAMFFVAWMLARAFAGGLPEESAYRETWASCGLLGIELLAWGVFFSLLLKRTLVAAILAGITGSIFAVPTFSLFIASYHPVPIPPHVVVVQLSILALVIVAEFVLAGRWFRDSIRSPVRARRRDPSDMEIEAILDGVLPIRAGKFVRGAAGKFVRGDVVPTTSAATMLGRLLWQELRQSVVVSACLIALLLLTAVPLWLRWADVKDDGFPHWLELVIGPLAWAVFCSSLAGSTVFFADQSGSRFRYLTEHGIPPRLVWLSRQIRGLAILLVALVLILPPTIGVLGFGQTGGVHVVACLLGAMAGAYACGQLASMTSRSWLIAVTSGTGLTIVVGGWAGLMNELGLSWLWSVAPLTLAFVAFTWLVAPNWLLERRTWRARLVPALVIAVPVMAILIAVPLVRVCEIPLVALDFDPDGLASTVTAEESETQALYARAIEFVKKAKDTEKVPAWEKRRLEAQAVALAIEASRRPLPDFYVDSPTDRVPAETELAYLVLASGQPLAAEGKLDAALDRYLAAERIASYVRRRWPVTRIAQIDALVCDHLVHWAALNGQKPERVVNALRTSEEQWRIPSTYCDDIEYSYLVCRRNLESGIYCPLAVNWLPWERARAVRLLDKVTAEVFARQRETESVLAAGGFISASSDRDFVKAVHYELRGEFALEAIGYIEIYASSNERVIIEGYHRAARLVLALDAWKLDHGKLPRSLDELRGKYLDELPVSPFTGTKFRYSPPYVACDVWRSQSVPSLSQQAMVPGDPWSSEWDAAGRQGVWMFPIP